MAYILTAALPFVALALIITVERLSDAIACGSVVDGGCLFGPAGTLWPDLKVADTLLHAHRGVTLVHYFAYGAVLAMFSHRAFASIASRIVATGLGGASTTVPGLLLEIYSAWVRVSDMCPTDGTAIGNCAMAGEVISTQYAPVVAISWLLVFTLPVAIALGVGHAIVALGIEIFGRG